VNKISLVISAFNEEANIERLFRELRENELSDVEYDYILVDDGSTDGTVAAVERVVDGGLEVKLLSFSRNFGHEIAMTAGLDASTGEAVVFMDADLQHPPATVPKFIREWRDGAPIVLGKRVVNDGCGWFYSRMSNSFYSLLNYLTGFDTTRNYPDFRLLDRHYVEILKTFKEHSRMFRGFVYWMGAKNDIAEVEFAAPARAAGESKYFISDLLGLGCDAIFAFSLKPMKLSLFFSGLGVLFSFALGLYLYIPYLFEHIDPPGFLTVMFAVLIMGSAQLMILAIFAEYIGRIHLEVKRRPLYVLRKNNRGDRRHH